MTSPFVEIDVLEATFFQDDSLLQRIRRCNRGIRDYLDKVPSSDRGRYRIHLRTVTPKQAVYGVYYYKG